PTSPVFLGLRRSKACRKYPGRSILPAACGHWLDLQPAHHGHKLPGETPNSLCRHPGSPDDCNLSRSAPGAPPSSTRCHSVLRDSNENDEMEAASQPPDV